MVSKQLNKATREKILISATTLFLEKGYIDISLQKIALAAGLKQGHIYYHFQTKKELGIAVLKRWAETVEAHLAELGKKNTPEEKILSYLEWSETQEMTYFNFGCPIAKLTEDILQNINTEERNSVPIIYFQILDWLYARLIEYGFNQSNARNGASFILSTVQGTIHIGHVLGNRKVYFTMRTQLKEWLKITAASQ